MTHVNLDTQPDVVRQFVICPGFDLHKATAVPMGLHNRRSLGDSGAICPTLIDSIGTMERQRSSTSFHGLSNWLMHPLRVYGDWQNGVYGADGGTPTSFSNLGYPPCLGLLGRPLFGVTQKAGFLNHAENLRRFVAEMRFRPIRCTAGWGMRMQCLADSSFLFQRQILMMIGVKLQLGGLRRFVGGVCAIAVKECHQLIGVVNVPDRVQVGEVDLGFAVPAGHDLD